MKKTVTLRHLTLGEGLPAVCVPVMGRNKKEILDSAREALASGPDLIEWRADYLPADRTASQNDLSSKASSGREGSLIDLQRVQWGVINGILADMRSLIGETPLLVTFRSGREGGEREISGEEYREFYRIVLGSGRADAIDVELFQGEETVRELVGLARKSGVKTVLSNHDFHATPPEAELLARLARMQELGGDIGKIAVMPESMADVLALLTATEKASRTLSIPIITMSMGGRGAVSRILGELTGSVLTFGMAGIPSAPGQIPVGELRELLEEIHKISNHPIPASYL